ncbi:MAG: hypothetical protein ABIG42_00805, partial [bacterium]
MKAIEYLANWAFPLYSTSKYDLANSGLPEKYLPMPEISKGAKWWDMNGFHVIEEAKIRVAAL